MNDEDDERRVKHSDSIGMEDFGGYQNPYSATVDVEKEKRKQQELEEEEEN